MARLATNDYVRESESARGL